MNPLLLSGIFDLGKGLIDRLFPDPAGSAPQHTGPALQRALPARAGTGSGLPSSAAHHAGSG